MFLSVLSLKRTAMFLNLSTHKYFFLQVFKTLKSQLHLNVSLVGTFEFASAASQCRAVHLINIIAPVIVPTVDICSTNLTHKVWQIIILTDNFELISPTIDVCLTNFSLVWQMICLQLHRKLQMPFTLTKPWGKKWMEKCH